MSATSLSAQTSATYQHVVEAIEAVESYKKAPYFVKSNVEGKFGYDSSQWVDERNMVHYRNREESETFKEQNGVTTYFAWEGGLYLSYDTQWLFHSWPFIVQGVAKSRPTGNVTFQVTQQGITIKIYNDVQYNCDFDAAGRPKACPCPFTELLGCKTGTRLEDADFTIEGMERKKFKANVSCQHSKVQLIAGHGGGSTRWNNTTGKLENVGTGGDPFSPWKYKHTLTIKLSFDDLAKAAGLRRKELMQELVTKGFKELVTHTVLQSLNMVFYQQQDVTKTSKWLAQKLEPLNNILCYKFLKETGYSLEDIKATMEKERLAQEEKRQEEAIEANRKKAERDSIFQHYLILSGKAKDIYESDKATQQDLEQAIILFDSASVYADKAYQIALTEKDTLLQNKALKGFGDAKYFYKTACLYLMSRRFASGEEEIVKDMLNYKDKMPHFCYMLYREFAKNDAKAEDYEQAVENIGTAFEAFDYYLSFADKKGFPVDWHFKDSIDAELSQDLALYQYHIALQRYYAKDYEGFYSNIPRSDLKDIDKLAVLGAISLLISQQYEGDESMSGHRYRDMFRNQAIYLWRDINKIEPNYSQRDTPFVKEMIKLLHNDNDY